MVFNSAFKGLTVTHRNFWRCRIPLKPPNLLSQKWIFISPHNAFLKANFGYNCRYRGYCVHCTCLIWHRSVSEMLPQLKISLIIIYFKSLFRAVWKYREAFRTAISRNVSRRERYVAVCVGNEQWSTLTIMSYSSCFPIELVLQVSVCHSEIFVRRRLVVLAVPVNMGALRFPETSLTATRYGVHLEEIVVTGLFYYNSVLRYFLLSKLTRQSVNIPSCR